MSMTTGKLFYRSNDKELRKRSDWNELSEDEEKELLLKIKIHSSDGVDNLEWFEEESLYPPDRYWDGEIVNGVPHGQGTFYVPESYNPVVEYYNDSKFVGIYKNGVRLEGTYTWSNGNKYIGNYKDNKRWNGEMICVDGKDNSKYVNGNVENNDEPLTLLNAQSRGHFS